MRRWSARRAKIVGSVFLCIVVLFLTDGLWAVRTPTTLSLRSVGESATLQVDRTPYPFRWPEAPLRAFPPSATTAHEWGIDGSETLTLDNSDPTYLAAIGTHPYIRFDRWLRMSSGYDAWQTVRVAPEATRRLPSILLQSGRTTRLPGRFRLDVTIQHLEAPIALRLAGSRYTYSIVLNRSGRSVSIMSRSHRGAKTSLLQAFYPKVASPFLAENVQMLALSVAWALLLLGVTTLLALLLPRRLATLIVERSPARFLTSQLSVLAILFSLAFTLFITLNAYNGQPHIYDSENYLLQAKTLAGGQLTAPPPKVPAFFPIPFFGTIISRANAYPTSRSDALHLFLSHGNATWATVFSPGTAMTLVPGLWLGVPWLLHILMGAGILLLTGLIARRLFGAQVAVVAVLLGALSPLHLFLTGTMLSHTPTAFFIMLAYYLLVQGEWGRSITATFLAGAAMGMAVLCREMSGLVLSLPLAAVLFTAVWRRRPGWALPFRLLALSLGAAPFAAFYLFYNWWITGDALTLPRAVLTPSDRFGFGDGIGFYGQHTLAAGLVNIDQQLTGLALDLFGWPFYMALAIPLVPFVLGRANRWDILNLVMALGIIVGYGAYYYHGIIYGPRHYYEAVPLLVLLAARGIQVLGAAAGTVASHLQKLLSRVDGPSSSRMANGQVASYVLLAALSAPALLFYIPRQLALYRDFTALPSLPNSLPGVHFPIERIYDAAPRHSIVVTGDVSVFRTILCSLNDPFTLAGLGDTPGNVWAVASTPAQYHLLQNTYAARPLYILQTTSSSVHFLLWRA